MNRSIALTGLLGLFGVCVWMMSGLAAAQSPTACALIGEKEALALVGGPLGEISKGEQKPTAQNGQDHNTRCSFFPKGYDLRNAPDRPPERGLILELHAMRNSADAKAFYEKEVGTAQQSAKAPVSAFAGGKAVTRVTPLSGIGTAATMEADTITFEPKAVFHMATVHFLKGSVMGQMTVWRKAEPADEISRAAAKQVIAKLP